MPAFCKEMTKLLALGPALALTLGALPAYAQYPDTFALIEVADPLSGANPTYPLIPMPPPAAGDSFWEPRFGTRQVRATSVDGIHGRHEYSRFDPFNSDRGLVLLDPGDPWRVYRTNSPPYNQPANLIRQVDLGEPRWDTSDPDILWGFRDFSIVTVNVTNGQEATVKDFTSDPVLGPIIVSSPVYRITMKDEGESSRDKRYWAFMLQGDASAGYEPLYLFTYDRALDTVAGVLYLPPGQREIDWVGMSVLGGYVVILGYNGSGPIQGLASASRDFSWIKTVRPSIGHADVGIDMLGREVVVGQNAGNDYVELVPLDTAAQAVPVVRLYYASGPQGLQSGIHVSCNADSFALISTTIGPGDPEQNWLDRSIILVRLDPSRPRAFYLSKLYNTTQEYWEETHGTISNDGSLVVWADNWGQQVGQEQMSLTQLLMPPNWRQLCGVEGESEGNEESGRLSLKAGPNPFTSSTAIWLEMPEPGRARAAIYDAAGRLVRTLKDGLLTSGRHRINWDGRNATGARAAAGVYFASVGAGYERRCIRLMLIR
jgi:hypothetical protein